jgi:hypothetical protein
MLTNSKDKTAMIRQRRPDQAIFREIPDIMVNSEGANWEAL